VWSWADKAARGEPRFLPAIRIAAASSARAKRTRRRDRVTNATRREPTRAGRQHPIQALLKCRIPKTTRKAPSGDRTFSPATNGTAAFAVTAFCTRRWYANTLLMSTTRPCRRACTSTSTAQFGSERNSHDHALSAARTSVKTTFTPQPAGTRPGLAQPRVRRGSPKGGCPGVSGTLTMPGRTLTCRASGKPGLASGLPLGRQFRIAYLARSHEKSPTRLRADRLGQADSPIQDSQALAPIFA
jgi:hypothetical protein